ncbi:hypothetical protein ACFU53_22020 [Streptomyces sp. NPDC057474]|uniref:hypothetical protein n=1 Tax=Streptomyces sp. NPDC057474 TaxID=3346144 RepID=UPI00367B8ACF
MTTEQPLSLVHATAEEPPTGPAPFRRDDFNAFYTQEMSAVTVFLMHQGATAYEAADAAHEAMAKLLPDLWRVLDHPRTWLRVTAQRCYWRQSNTRTAPTDPVPARRGGTCPLTTVVISALVVLRSANGVGGLPNCFSVPLGSCGSPLALTRARTGAAVRNWRPVHAAVPGQWLSKLFAPTSTPKVIAPC